MDQVVERPEMSHLTLHDEVDEQQLHLTVPQRFIDPAQFHPDAKFNSKTELVVQDPVVRQMLINNLTRNLREEKKWACFHGDLDQLKLANKRGGRRFGDLFLRWGSFQITQAIERLGLSTEAKIVVVSSAHAADETNVWFFDLTDEDLQKIEELQGGVSREELEFKTAPFIFSISTSLITCDSPEIESYKTLTAKYLDKQPDGIAANFFQFVEDSVDVQADMMKLAKDLTQIPLEELLTKKSLIDFIRLVTQRYGGGRIHQEILEILQKLQSIETVRMLKYRVHKETYRTMLSDLGVDEERLSQIRSVEELVMIFQELFGASE